MVTRPETAGHISLAPGGNYGPTATSGVCVHGAVNWMVVSRKLAGFFSEANGQSRQDTSRKAAGITGQAAACQRPSIRWPS